MRIVFVLTDLRPDGVQVSMVQLAAQLDGMGHHTSVVPLARSTPDLHGLASELGVQIHRLQSTRLRHQVPELNGYLRRQQADVVHTALWNGDITGRLASVGTGAAVVSSFVSSPNDGPDLWPSRRRTRRQQAKRALDAATSHLIVAEFHAISTDAKAANVRSLRVPPERVTVVERGRSRGLLGTRSAERRRRVRELLGIPDHQPIVLGSGQLLPSKGHDVLIRAMPTVRREFPTAVLLIAGAHRGEQAAALMELSRRHGLDESVVRLLGHRDDLADLMAAAEVFAFPSYLEGGIATPAEALGIGTPLVTSRWPAIDEVLVDGEQALLVEPGSASQLAEAILDVLRRPGAARRRAEAGQRVFEERFSLDVAATRMQSLYEGALRRRRTANAVGAPGQHVGSHQPRH